MSSWMVTTESKWATLASRRHSTKRSTWLVLSLALHTICRLSSAAMRDTPLKGRRSGSAFLACAFEKISYSPPSPCACKHNELHSDMWALGCIAYEICSLRRPFEGANLSALVLQIVTAMPRPLTSRTASAPLAHKLIQNLLDKDSASRPS